MDSSSPLCGSRMQRVNQRGAMVWDVSQVRLHKDHHSPSHEGGPGDIYARLDSVFPSCVYTQEGHRQDMVGGCGDG